MAASTTALLALSFTSLSALSEYQPVQATGAAATAGGNAVGFSDTVVPSAGQRFAATSIGTSLAVAGAAIAVGALIEVHSTVTQVVTRSAGVAIGRALTAASGAGDVIQVLLISN